MYSFFAAFSWEPILYSFIGAAAGILWGALPGLSMTMGMDHGKDSHAILTHRPVHEGLD